MRISLVHLLWLLVLASVMMGIAGCASDDPDNESVRPWNSPSGYGGTMPIQDEQHPE